MSSGTTPCPVCYSDAPLLKVCGRGCSLCQDCYNHQRQPRLASNGLPIATTCPTCRDPMLAPTAIAGYVGAPPPILGPIADVDGRVEFWAINAPEVDLELYATLAASIRATLVGIDANIARLDASQAALDAANAQAPAPAPAPAPQTAPVERRCGACRQTGHDRRNCPSLGRRLAGSWQQGVAVALPARRARRVYHCGNCGVAGHNSRTCGLNGVDV